MTFDIDFSEIARKTLNLATRSVMLTFTGGLIVGKSAQSLYVMFKPGIDAYFKDIADFGAVSDIQWLIVGVALAFVVSWPWRIARRWWRGGMSPAEKADEYIAVMKHALTQAESSTLDRKLFWNAVLHKLAQDFKIDVRPQIVDVVAENAQTSARASNRIEQSKD